MVNETNKQDPQGVESPSREEPQPALSIQVRQAYERADEAMRRVHRAERALAELVRLRDYIAGLPFATGEHKPDIDAAWQAARAALAAQALREEPPPGSVRLPRSRAEAELMVKLGSMYLQEGKTHDA